MRHLKQDLHVSQKIEHCSDSLKFRILTRVHSLFFASPIFYNIIVIVITLRAFTCHFVQGIILTAKIVSTYKSSYRDDFCTIAKK